MFIWWCYYTTQQLHHAVNIAVENDNKAFKEVLMTKQT